MAPWADVLYAMDRVWWKEYGEEALSSFSGELWAPLTGIRGVRKASFDYGKNSGLGAISLAAHWGAQRIILIGYDCQKTDGNAHWHADHPNGLGNAGAVDKWPQQFADLAKRLSAEVVNASRVTALECFPRVSLSEALKQQTKAPLFIQGMHGLGDNLHQRSVVRQLSLGHEIWLETPWPCLYHDMPGVNLVGKGSKLRTQAKNAARERDRFTARPVPRSAKRLEVKYPPEAVRRHGSVLAAMSNQCGVESGEFRLPIPEAWRARADDLVRRWSPDRPLMIYRPLVERTEWGGCRNRNPDHAAYADLFRSVREDFFVVSVADVAPGKEWIVGERIDADVELHAGELDIEVLAALVAKSALVYTAPGFAVILAQAVGVPSVAVFGGYENSQSFSAGVSQAPYLGVDPIKPCNCFSHSHRCEKRIDMVGAKRRLLEFVNAHCSKQGIRTALAA